ncbi:hypothetical protein VIBHAR_00973 [Vibrio campbellii ATCC BAA-1116]|jgi:hypothetical protein|uniref:Uncharacterized protein n=1 Tax=Vibrio campbellii (strain ATCC BAA-1116) TaxID=2902295 RepID=A7MXK2_VIBC1|nr:hypothetical protein VIBHAR_00973 [Vibrio campbellii ATCC BAA-1116]
MNAKLAQRNQRVVLEIGAAVEVAWFIIIFSVDLSVRLFGLLLKLRAMLEMKYFSNMTVQFLWRIFIILFDSYL